MDKKDKRNLGEGDEPNGDDDRTQAFDSEKTEVSNNQLDKTFQISGSDIPTTLTPPSVTGYKILGILGKGGMGIVYEAEQQNPKRKVALKVMLHAKATDENFVRMFEREVETLARLTHPHIGNIYESGRTDDGQYFFAMEIVKGKTLDEYLSDSVSFAELTPSDIRIRLMLFHKIVNAVHYAHQRSVIHRDLKPANIVVSEEQTSGSGSRSEVPEIKILDFGLARITDTDVHMTQVTEIGVIKGTLAYMSPEQAKGNPNDIDVRSDVYSLGVILYQLLSGKLPKEIPGSMLEALRVITETKAKPLDEIFRGKKRLDPDIATICHKALELIAEDRYGSASAMAEDIERYLTNQPIQARPPSTVYQLKKMIKRNKLTTAFVATVFFLLIGLAVTMSVLQGEAEEARAEAEKRAEELEIVTDFQASMLSGIDAKVMGLAIYENLTNRVKESFERENLSATKIETVLNQFQNNLDRTNPTDVALTLIDEQVLQRAVETIEEDFADQPLIQAALKQTVGETYGDIGFYQEALPLMEEALETYRHILGNEHNTTNVSIHNMGWLLSDMGKEEEALVYYKEEMDGNRRLLGEDHTSTLSAINDVAGSLSLLGKYEEALVYRQEVLDGSRRVHGDSHKNTLVSLNNIGSTLERLGQYDKALVYFQEALETSRRVFGDDNRNTFDAMNNMGSLLESMGKQDEALVYLQDVLEGRRRLFGDDHRSTIRAMTRLGTLLNGMGRYDEALVYYQEELDGYRRVLGNDHPETLISINNTGYLLSRMGKYDEALVIYREALEGYRRVYGENHFYSLNCEKNLGDLLVEMNLSKESKALLLPDVEKARKEFRGRDTWRLGIFLSALGKAQSELGEYHKGGSNLHEAYEMLSELRGTKRENKYEDVLSRLVSHYRAWHEAEPNKGYDKKATEWQTKLDERQASK